LPPPAATDPEPTPSPTPSRSRRRAPADSSPASSAAEFFDAAHQGPGFDPETAPAAPVFDDEDDLDQVAEEGWREESIEEYLTMIGDVAHAALRVGEEDQETGKMTERDLKRIAPPLTRILNRYDTTRALAVAGDEGLAIAGLAAYGTRNYTRRRRLIAARNALPEQPVSGRAAEPRTGPEHDPDWARVNQHTDHQL
nr:hypothetical protein [Actinomycetota bacterium]